jgi:hypothetical protein
MDPVQTSLRRMADVNEGKKTARIFSGPLMQSRCQCLGLELVFQIDVDEPADRTVSRGVHIRIREGRGILGPELVEHVVHADLHLDVVEIGLTFLDKG